VIADRYLRENYVYVQRIEKRCFMCMETRGRGEAMFMNCKTCDRLYCSGCVERILGDGGVEQVLSNPAWGCFVCNESLTTFLRAQMFQFIDLATLNGHDMQCDHTIEAQCNRQSVHVAHTGSESVTSTSDTAVTHVVI